MSTHTPDGNQNRKRERKQQTHHRDAPALRPSNRIQRCRLGRKPTHESKQGKPNPNSTTKTREARGTGTSNIESPKRAYRNLSVSLTPFPNGNDFERPPRNHHDAGMGKVEPLCHPASVAAPSRPANRRQQVWAYAHGYLTMALDPTTAPRRPRHTRCSVGTMAPKGNHRDAKEA